MGQTYVTRLDGPSPEQEVARDIVRRALPVSPLLVLVGALIGGVDGALSTAYGLALVLTNFVLSAALLAWSARISLGLMMGVALGGYLVRLGLIFCAVWLVRDASWVHLTALGATIIVSHLGLLVWELRYVSLSLAYPGLRPRDASANPVRGSASTKENVSR